MDHVDARCNNSMCEPLGVYRMVGSCSNCRAADIIVLFTAEHPTSKVKCPSCGCREVTSKRLATPEEIPAS